MPAAQPDERGSDAVVWTASHARDSPCASPSGPLEFPGIVAALPGLAATVSMGDPTIAVLSNPGPCASARAPGVVFPTAEASMLPIIPRDQFDDALSAGRERSGMLFDVQCNGPPTEASAACSLPAPPRISQEADWQGGLSQHKGWVDGSGASVAVSDVAGRHFMTAARLATPSTLTLCSVPVVAAVQYGLCQGSATDTINQAPWLSAPLDDQATPLVLPVGEAPPSLLTAPGSRSVPAEYGGMAVHASLAWTLLPVVEPGLGHGVPALFHAVLALYGHAAVILPPGRLCGDAPARGGPRAGSNGTAAAAAAVNAAHLLKLVSRLADLITNPGRPSPVPRPGGPERPWHEDGLPVIKRPGTKGTVRDVLRLAVESRAIVAAAGLSPADCRAVHRWLDALDAVGFAYAPIKVSASDGCVLFVVFPFANATVAGVLRRTPQIRDCSRSTSLCPQCPREFRRWRL